MRKLARGEVLAGPATRLGTPKRTPHHECRGGSPELGGQGHEDTALGEADDIRVAVAVNVRHKAGEFVLAAPAARLGTPKRSPVDERGGLKPPGSVGQGHEDTVSGEAHDIRVAVEVYVRKLAREGVLAAPAARLGPPKRTPVCERGVLKPPGSVGEGHVDTARGEAHDIRVAVAVYVRKQAREGVVAAPAARLGPPRRSPVGEGGGLKPPGSVGQGHVDRVGGEAHDIRVAVVVYVR